MRHACCRLLPCYHMRWAYKPPPRQLPSFGSCSCCSYQPLVVPQLSATACVLILIAPCVQVGPKPHDIICSLPTYIILAFPQPCACMWAHNHLLAVAFPQPRICMRAHKHFLLLRSLSFAYACGPTNTLAAAFPQPSTLHMHACMPGNIIPPRTAATASPSHDVIACRPTSIPRSPPPCTSTASMTPGSPVGKPTRSSTRPSCWLPATHSLPLTWTTSTAWVRLWRRPTHRRSGPLWRRMWYPSEACVVTQ